MTMSAVYDHFKFLISLFCVNYFYIERKYQDIATKVERFVRSTEAGAHQAIQRSVVFMIHFS